MDYQEIKERIGWGEEFLFYYKSEKYWISQSGTKHYLTRATETQEFLTTEDLFQNARVDGKTLIEIWDDIKQYF